MQQPALPNLNMASRAGIQPGGGSTMYQQVHNLPANTVSFSHPTCAVNVTRQFMRCQNPCLAPFTAGPAGALTPVLQSYRPCFECHRRR